MNRKSIKLLFLFLFGLDISFASDIYAPKPLSEILREPTSSNWTPSPVSTIENRSHVVFIDATGSYCLQVNSTLVGELTVGNVSSMENGTATYGEVLQSMFQLLDLNVASLATNELTGTYTIHPELASYHALDYDGGAFVVKDKSSFYHTEQTNSAFLVFSLEGTPESTTLQASSRYEYDTLSDSYVLDNTWQTHWVVLGDNQELTLSDASTEATEWMVADARELIEIGVDAGDDFNPGSTSWQTKFFCCISNRCKYRRTLRMGL